MRSTNYRESLHEVGRFALRPPGVIALTVLVVDLMAALLVLSGVAVCFLVLAAIAGLIVGCCVGRGGNNHR